MEQGTQVAYIPTHAKGDVHHPDCEYGFVMSKGKVSRTYFCRYWVKGKPGVLRTVANSECTDETNLKRYQSVTQDVVTAAIKQIQKDFEEVTEGLWVTLKTLTDG